jgi:hypothetical protein
VTIKEFARSLLEGNSGLERCYIAIMPNEGEYDLEVEVSEGTIAGNFSTGTRCLRNARRMADELEKELAGLAVKVYGTRQEWERRPQD